MANETTQPPVRDALAGAQSFATWLDLVRKITVSLALILGIGGATVLVVREIFRGGVFLEPIFVDLRDKNSLSKERAAQQIGDNIELIEQSGFAEWRKLYVSQSAGQIDLPLPGAPLTLRTSLREVAALVGVRQPALRVSVTDKGQSGYHASIAVVGQPDARSSCDVGDEQGWVDKILECIALRAIGLIDPKVAATHALKLEARDCKDLDSGQADEDQVTREARGIESRRKRCAFDKTKALVAEVLKRGHPDDHPWMSYVLGHVHLERAKALASIDPHRRQGELDQAIGRFSESKEAMRMSQTALTVRLEAFVTKGDSIRETTVAAAWSDDDRSRQWQLQLAAWAFSDAEQELKSLPRHRGQALRVLVRRSEAKLILLQWLLASRHNPNMASVPVAIGLPDRLKELRIAAGHYAYAAANGLSSAELLLEWGQVLHAVGDFEDAVKMFERAADLNPGDSKARLAIPLALLDRIEYTPQPNRTLLHILIALGASADYLGWSLETEPPRVFITRIEAALALSGDWQDASLFGECRERSRAASGTARASGIERWQAIAALKVCVDQAIARISNRNSATELAKIARIKDR